MEQEERGVALALERLPSTARSDTSRNGTSDGLIHPEGESEKNGLLPSPVTLFKQHYGAFVFVAFAVTVLLLGRFVAKWNFGWKGWTALGLIFCSFLAMIKSISDPEWILLSVMCSLVAILPKHSIITVDDALDGFANESVGTVAALFALAHGIHASKALDFVLHYVLGNPSSTFLAQVRLMFPVACFSAFLNNTPIVAMLIPVVQTWAKRIHVPASKLLIPLSYATILGGTVTVIGTSTNLTVLGLAKKKVPGLHLNIFELAIVGLPNAVVGLAYLMIVSRWLLPVRGGIESEFTAHVREYTVAVQVKPSSPIAGKTIEAAELRGLTGLYLFEVRRGDQLIPAPSREFVLQEGDVLVFTGNVSSVKDLWLTEGLVPATNQTLKISGSSSRQLIEAVVGLHSNLVGQSVKQSRFRTRYNAAVIAIHRGAERIQGKLGDVVLQGGDTLLLEANPHFFTTHRDSADFALIAPVENTLKVPRDRFKMWSALGILVCVIALATSNIYPMFVSALLGVFAMIACRCMSVTEAWGAVRTGVLLSIACSFSLGIALDKNGVGKAVAHTITNIFQKHIGGIGILFGLYITTALLSALLSNNATVAILFPIAYELVLAGQLPLKAVIYTLMMAASADFSTPIGYQTNLMVYAAGGYKFTDFTKIGLPLQLLGMIVSCTIIWFVWGKT